MFLVVYITVMQCLSAFSLAANIGVITLYHKKCSTHQMPLRFRDLFLNKLGSFLRVLPKHSDNAVHPINIDENNVSQFIPEGKEAAVKKDSEVDNNRSPTVTCWKEDKRGTENDWINLGRVIDRIFLLLCSTFVLIITVSLLALFYT